MLPVYPLDPCMINPPTNTHHHIHTGAEGRGEADGAQARLAQVVQPERRGAARPDALHGGWVRGVGVVMLGLVDGSGRVVWRRSVLDWTEEPTLSCVYPTNRSTIHTHTHAHIHPPTLSTYTGGHGHVPGGAEAFSGGQGPGGRDEGRRGGGWVNGLDVFDAPWVLAVRYSSACIGGDGGWVGGGVYTLDIL